MLTRPPKHRPLCHVGDCPFTFGHLGKHHVSELAQRIIDAERAMWTELESAVFFGEGRR